MWSLHRLIIVTFLLSGLYGSQLSICFRFKDLLHCVSTLPASKQGLASSKKLAQLLHRHQPGIPEQKSSSQYCLVGFFFIIGDGLTIIGDISSITFLRQLSSRYYDVLHVTRALVICLICMHLPLCLQPSGSCIHIR